MMISAAASLVRSSRSSALRHTHVFRVSYPIQPQLCRSFPRQFSTPKTQIPASAEAPVSFLERWRRRFSSDQWRRVARIVRYTRIPFLVLSVYSLGYQQGIIDDSRNPQGTRQALLDNVYASVGVTDRKNVHIVHDGDTSLLKSQNVQAKRIARIGRSIVKVARGYVQDKVQTVAEQIRSKLPQDVTEEQFLAVLLQDEEFTQWHKAKMQLEGNWSYLLLETKLPNAFVSEILPKRIFVTIAMLDIIQNDDELALVLGHEVSHLILGHLSQRNMVETMLRTVEVLLLSVDPTEGLLSLAIVGSLATIRQGVSAAFSRDHEREADELGIKLAAMACYDTERAATVFQRLHEREQVPTTSGRFLSFADSHPPTEERFQGLVTASQTENADSYDNCARVRKRLGQAKKSGGWFV